MILTSLKPESQIVTLPVRILPDYFTFDNYIKILTVPRGVDLVRSFLNSLVVACAGTARSSWSTCWPPIRWRACAFRVATRCSF